MLFDKIVSKVQTASDIAHVVGRARFFKKVVPWIFHRDFFFYTQSLNEEFPVPSCKVPLKMELITEKDLPCLIELRPRFYRIDLIRRRLKEGHLCFLGWSGKKPIHLRWAFLHSYPLYYLHKTIVLFPDEVFVDEAWISPEYRRLGVYSYSGYLMRQILKNMGYRRIICAFASWNFPAQKASERLGMKNSGSGGYWNILGIKKYFLDKEVQDYGGGKIFVKRVS